jgi:hypothetical protein
MYASENSEVNNHSKVQFVDYGELPFEWTFGENQTNDIDEYLNSKKKEFKENQEKENQKTNRPQFVYVNNLVVDPKKQLVNSVPKWQKMIEKNSLEKDKTDFSPNQKVYKDIKKKSSKSNSYPIKNGKNMENIQFNFP